MTQETLDKINKFARRPLTEDEVYTFSVILCDNDIDRDLERFSDAALETLKEIFIGRTGIFDHDASSANQNARIYSTEVVTDDTKTTSDGRPYRYLKAEAYMVRTDDNRNLIAEIDGGIKKEVSISCSAAKRICSVCGRDRNENGCSHQKGVSYSGRLCHSILDDITDAYEWSFVAVPAQVNAGVTKHFTDSGKIYSYTEADIKAADDELRRDIRRFAYFAGGREAADMAALSAKNMSPSQLIAFRNNLEAKCRGGIDVQLDYDKAEDDASGFSMR